MRFYLLPEKFDYIPGQREIDTVMDMLRDMPSGVEIEYWGNEDAIKQARKMLH